MSHKYELTVAWSSEDAAFVVDVPELPGCMAHGATPAEAVANAQEAISLWLEFLRVPPGNRLERLSVESVDYH